MKLLPLTILIAAVASGAWVSRFRDELNPAVRSTGLEAGEEAAGASLLGQFRSSAASSLYARADLYLHGGVELRPMTDNEKRSGKQGSSLKEGEAQVLGDESHLVTTIPSADDDYRGLFGDLERATSAYKDMHNHKHNDPETTFPLFRLMTWIDPQFLEGWSLGAMLLANNYTDQDLQKAVSYLDAGIAANPTSIELMTEKARLIAAREHKYNEAIALMERAHHQVLEKGFQKSQAETVEEMYGLLADLYYLTGQYDKLRQLLVEGLRLFPDNQRLLNNQERLSHPSAN
jgi:tetratricopeptide (TPR) repeat protein